MLFTTISFWMAAAIAQWPRPFPNPAAIRIWPPVLAKPVISYFKMCFWVFWWYLTGIWYHKLHFVGYFHINLKIKHLNGRGHCWMAAAIQNRFRRKYSQDWPLDCTKSRNSFKQFTIHFCIYWELETNKFEQIQQNSINHEWPRPLLNGRGHCWIDIWNSRW